MTNKISMCELLGITTDSNDVIEQNPAEIHAEFVKRLNSVKEQKDLLELWNKLMLQYPELLAFFDYNINRLAQSFNIGNNNVQVLKKQVDALLQLNKTFFGKLNTIEKHLTQLSPDFAKDLEFEKALNENKG